MARGKISKKKLDDIRKQAEALIEKDPYPAERLSPQDLSTLLDELRIHQIELKLQNEELQRSQAELEEISEKYRELYDAAPVGYVTMDMDGLIQEINLRGAELLGTPRRWLLKKHFLQFVSKEDLSRFLDHRKALLQNRSLQTCELRLLSKRGQPFEALLESIPKQDPEGNVVSIRTAIMDISEREKTERKLVEAERQFRTLAENAPDIIARFDKDLCYTYANPAIELYTGIRRERFLGKTNAALSMPSQLTELWTPVLKKVLETGVREASEFNYPAPTGATSFHAWTVPEFNEAGEVKSVLTIVRDVSDLTREQARLQAILDNAPVAIVVTDADCRLTMVNQPAKEIFAQLAPSHQLVELHAGLNLCHPDGTPFDPLHLPLSRSVFQGEVYENLEMSILWPEGRTGTLIVNAAPIKGPDGRVLGAVGVFKDITDLVEQREALRRSRDELEVRVKDRTADLVHAKTILEIEVSERRRAEAILKTHEEELEKLNEQLKLEIEKRKKFEKGLKSSTEKIIQEHNQRRALSRQLVDLLEKDRRELAMALHDHAGQILTTLKMDLEAIENKMSQDPAIFRLRAAKDKTLELLAFMRDISRQLRPSTIDTLGLVASVRNLVDQLQTTTEAKIAFHTGNLPESLGHDIKIALYRIIQESLTNALKHAHAKNLYVNLISKGRQNALLMSIEDDGQGFDQGYEPDNVPEAGHLGITIMRERAVLLGGDFRIESNPGKGTVVMVEMPFG